MTSLRVFGLAALAVLAIVVHLFGWLAPLTPSEGLPSLVELAIFYLMPAGILVYCGISHRGIVRYLYFVLCGLLIYFYADFYLTVLRAFR